MLLKFNIFKSLMNDFYKKILMVLFILFSVLKRVYVRKNGSCWLIGENRGECLKENGYWFYKYCRENYPEQDVYFVIKEFSPFYQKELSTDPFVIEFGSIKHAKIFSVSSICFYTHTYKDIIYRRIFEVFGKPKQLVYLHHGVFGFKKFNSFYYLHRNDMKIFTVGNNFEKEILVNQAHVDKEKIKVTGYARYDALVDRASTDSLQIVYMPTHRNFIKKDFIKSNFFQRIQSLLKNDCLLELLKYNRIIFKVYLHKEFQKYSNYFSAYDNLIKIIKLGEETPQELISRSHLLITDYSSVSWDFFYLGKPVVFYRFDINEYLRDRNSYLDLKKNIIGDVVYNEEKLISIIENYIDNNFKIRTQNRLFRYKILPNIDKHNRERIYKSVKALDS